LASISSEKYVHRPAGAGFLVKPRRSAVKCGLKKSSLEQALKV